MADSVSWKNKVNITFSETQPAGRMQMRSKIKNEFDFFFLVKVGFTVTVINIGNNTKEYFPLMIFF